MKQLLVSKRAKLAFSTIQAAIDQAQEFETCQILVESGLYKENIKIYQDDLWIQGIGEVIITGDWSAIQRDEEGKLRTTFQTATVFVNAKNVHLVNLLIRNTAGPGEKVGQAVALYLEGNNICVDACRLDAYQDTLCLGPLPETNKDGSLMDSPWIKRKFNQQTSCFLNCWISGTVDFIFGGGQATFESCQLKVKNSSSPNYVTAAATPQDQAGLLFKKCEISGASPYYLGRPWRDYAKVRFQDCHFDRQLLPEGWHDWNKAKARQTVSYEEIACSYQGSSQREAWITKKGDDHSA